MANVTCPQCQQRLDAPEDAAQARCPYCDHVFTLPDTRMTADPPPASQAFQADIERKSSGAGNIAFELPERYASWEEFRGSSPAIERELMKLATQALPDLRRIMTLPLPEETPVEIDGWSKPLGTLVIPGETWFSNRLASAFLIGIGLFMMTVAPLSFIIEEKEREKVFSWVTAFWLLGLGAVVAFYGVWFTFTRRPMLGLTLWIFEEGLFMRRGDKTTVARFEEVRAFNTSHETHRPLFWITLEDEAPIVLSVGHCPEVIPLMEYIEVRMAAAQLLPRLKAIFDGERLRFGIVTLDKRGFHGLGFDALWADVRKVVPDDRRLFVDWSRRSEWVAIRYRDVSFPHLVMAISHVLIEEHARLSAPPP